MPPHIVGSCSALALLRVWSMLALVVANAALFAFPQKTGAASDLATGGTPAAIAGTASDAFDNDLGMKTVRKSGGLRIGFQVRRSHPSTACPSAHAIVM
jgi:hypothetical protein